MSLDSEAFGGAVLNQFSEIWSGLNWGAVTEILIAIIPAFICITIHELSHGLAAYIMGDKTAKDMGRLTLNPIKHIDPTGLLMMILFRFGWAKPVPVDMRNFKNPKLGMAITAAAGPASNIILSAVFLFLLGFFHVPLLNAGGFGRVVIETLNTAAYLSIALAVFNTLPIPPMDGSKVLFSFLPNSWYYKLMRYERYGMFLLIGFVWMSRSFGSPLTGVTSALYNSMFQIAEWSFNFYTKIM